MILDARPYRRRRPPAPRRRGGDPFTRASIKLKEREARLKEFCAQTGLTQQRERLQVAGFGRSQAQRAVQANRRIAIQKRNAIIEAAIKRETGFYGDIHIVPHKIDVEALGFDAEHVAKRKHSVTEQEAKDFIRKAKVSVVRMNGKFLNFYSEDGAAYVIPEENVIRTAFKSSEYDPRTKALMEAVKRYGQ